MQASVCFFPADDAFLWILLRSYARHDRRVDLGGDRWYSLRLDQVLQCKLHAHVTLGLAWSWCTNGGARDNWAFSIHESR